MARDDYHRDLDSLPNPSISFTFNLASTLRTSAGVFTEDSVLIRTLWSGVTYNAGTHTATWDGTTDEGILAADGNYKVRVLSNNVQYVWEGTVGNNSDANTGPTVQRGYERIVAMAVAGQYAYYARAYSEGSPSQMKLDVATPGSAINVQPANQNTGQETDYVATDGINVYWAGNDPYAATQFFVFATKNSDDSETIFPFGSPLKAVRGRTYPSVIDTVKNANAVITGLAVQPTSDFLFVSHQKMNVVHVLNKTTGERVQTLSFTAPGVLATDSANNLWMAYTSGGNPTVEKFSVDTSGILTSTGITLPGIVKPLALGTSPDNQTIVVADGGISQQLKAFNIATGAASWTHGQAGGYATGADVTDDKFYFSDIKKTFITFVAFQPDGTFWVGDPGNSRAQHYAADRTFIDRIMYQPHFYACFVDGNDPTRVFADFREFRIDYSKPLGRNNGSWALVKNWGHNVPSAQDNKYNNLRGVATLSNGRTYAMVQRSSTSKWEIVELPDTGNIRFTGVLLNVDNTQLYPDGSLRKVTKLVPGQPTVWTKRPLTGFDGSGNPLWGTAAVVAKTPPITSTDPGYWGNTNKLRAGEVTSTGVVIAFDGAEGHPGFNNYHLGGVRAGDSTWLWRTAPSTPPNYNGPFPPDGAYDIGNGVEYSGVSAMASQRNIIWGYHGEFWKASQTNKWNHVYDNGLFVGQFGVTGPEVAGQPAPAGMAGNSFCANLVTMGDTAYLYHNDEGYHSGIHRWMITGLNTIQEQEVPVTMAMSGSGLLANYYNGTDLNNMRHTKSRIDSVVYIDLADTDIVDTTDFSVSWTGYMEPQYSESYIIYASANKGVRLWINDVLLVDQKDTTNPGEYSDTILLKAGMRYPIRMEVFQNGGAAAASLSWSSASQPKVEVPSTRLYPDEAPDYSGGYDLLEDLPYKANVLNGIYGWIRNPIAEDYTDKYNKYWTVRTNQKTYAKDARDLYIKFRYKTVTSAYVDRELGNVSSSDWELAGEVDYELNRPNEDHINLGPTGTGGSFIEVLDDQDKVIVRFFWNMNYPTKDTRLFANNKIIVNGQFNDMKAVYSIPQPFSISMSGDSATVHYGTYAPVTVAALDTAAHGNQPKKVRFYFWQKSFNSDRIIDVTRLKFSIGSGAPLMMRNNTSDLLKEPLLPSKPGLLIFPNPVKGTEFFIRLSEPVKQDVRVRITDMSGKTVFFKRIGGTAVQLDRKLPAGIYIVTVNEQFSQKLLVY